MAYRSSLLPDSGEHSNLESISAIQIRIFIDRTTLSIADAITVRVVPCQ